MQTTQAERAEVSQPKSSYSDALKNKDHDKETTQPISSGNLNHIKCPEEVKVTKVKLLPGRIEVRCNSKNNKLQTFLTEKLREEAGVEEKRPSLIKIMALNVSEHISKTQLEFPLASRNGDPHQVRAVSNFQSKNEEKATRYYLYQKSQPKRNYITVP